MTVDALVSYGEVRCNVCADKYKEGKLPQAGFTNHSQAKSYLVESSLGCLIQKPPLGISLSPLISRLLFPFEMTFYSGEMHLSP